MVSNINFATSHLLHPQSRKSQMTSTRKPSTLILSLQSQIRLKSVFVYFFPVILLVLSLLVLFIFSCVYTGLSEEMYLPRVETHFIGCNLGNHIIECQFQYSNGTCTDTYHNIDSIEKFSTNVSIPMIIKNNNTCRPLIGYGPLLLIGPWLLIILIILIWLWYRIFNEIWERYLLQNKLKHRTRFEEIQDDYYKAIEKTL